MSASIEIQLIAVFSAVACSLPGVFLVLRKMSMLSDSITHTILLGIVLAFFITGDLSSPLLLIGATLMGVITVWITESINKTQLVYADSSIGLVFPLLFSIAIILITRYAGSVHLDTDSVLLGELAFAPFERMIVFGTDIGAKALYITGALLLINVVFISLCLKELTLVSFDPVLATVLGISPTIIHYTLMTLVSLTGVGVFNSVGSVLVVAFMVGPPLCAYLLTDKVKYMLIISAVFGAVSGILGYQLAIKIDASISGCMAVVVGICFLVVFLFSPKKGCIGKIKQKRQQKQSYNENTLLLHLYHHQNTAEETEEAGLHTARCHLHWSEKKLGNTITTSSKKGLIYIDHNIVKLTQSGLEQAQSLHRQYFSLL